MTGHNDTRLSEELEQSVDPARRSLLRKVVSAAAVYSVPVVASFSMEGLRVGEAEAQALSPNMIDGNFGGSVSEAAPGSHDGPFGQLVSTVRRLINGDPDLP